MVVDQFIKDWRVIEMAMIDKACFDVVCDLEDWLSDPEFVDINRAMVHGRFLQIFKEKLGQTTPDALLDHIHDEIRMHLWSRRVSDYGELKHFEDVMWPPLKERLRANPATAQFVLEYGLRSAFVLNCLLDMKMHPGLSIPMGHGIGRNELGELEEIPRDDPAVRFMLDPSFSLFRFRTKCSQAEMKKAKRVLMLGGGTAMSLIARNYPLGKLDQEIVIYDLDSRMPEYLEQMIGCPLREAGIDFRTADFRTAFNDPEQFGKYDYIEMLGVGSYYNAEADAKELFAGIGRLLAPGGRVVFDLQVMTPGNQAVLAFDKVVMGWNTRDGDREMYCESSIDDAIATAQRDCKFGGLDLVGVQHEDIPAPAGVIFTAEKAA